MNVSTKFKLGIGKNTQKTLPLSIVFPYKVEKDIQEHRGQKHMLSRQTQHTLTKHDLPNTLSKIQYSGTFSNYIWCGLLPLEIFIHLFVNWSNNN